MADFSDISRTKFFLAAFLVFYVLASFVFSADADDLSNFERNAFDVIDTKQPSDSSVALSSLNLQGVQDVQQCPEALGALVRDGQYMRTRVYYYQGNNVWVPTDYWNFTSWTRSNPLPVENVVGMSMAPNTLDYDFASPSADPLMCSAEGVFTVIGIGLDVFHTNHSVSGETYPYYLALPAETCEGSNSAKIIEYSSTSSPNPQKIFDSSNYSLPYGGIDVSLSNGLYWDENMYFCGCYGNGNLLANTSWLSSSESSPHGEFSEGDINSETFECCGDDPDENLVPITGPGFGIVQRSLLDQKWNLPNECLSTQGRNIKCAELCGQLGFKSSTFSSCDQRSGNQPAVIHCDCFSNLTCCSDSTDCAFSPNNQLSSINCYSRWEDGAAQESMMVDVDNDGIKDVCGPGNKFLNSETDSSVCEVALDGGFKFDASWGSDDNHCCGNSGEDDNGILSEDADKVCVNCSAGLCVGRTGWNIIPSSERFKVSEINRDSFSFDVISNGDKWFVCKPSSGPAPLPNIYSSSETASQLSVTEGDVGSTQFFDCDGYEATCCYERPPGEEGSCGETPPGSAAQCITIGVNQPSRYIMKNEFNENPLGFIPENSGGEGAAGCSDIAKETDCSNGKDDDNDILIDCDDPDCQPDLSKPGPYLCLDRWPLEQITPEDQPPYWVSSGWDLCGNDKDDDGDGAIDCADDDCISHSTCAFEDLTDPSTSAEKAFICVNDHGTNRWIECCGGGRCVNGEKFEGVGHEERTGVYGLGDVINHIVDYDIVASGGVDIIDQIRFIPGQAGGVALPIFNPHFKDWSGFDYVEFDMWFNRQPSQIYFRNTGGAKVGNTLDLRDYSTNDFGIAAWHHLRIPLEDISSNSNNLKDIYRATITNAEYIILDNMFLSTTGDPIYCSGKYREWITGLDPPEGTTGTALNKYALTCNSQPSFRWTGLECCGDDQPTQKELDDSPAKTQEYHSGGNYGGCWKGQIVYSQRKVSDMTSDTARFNVLYNREGQGYAFQYCNSQGNSGEPDHTNTKDYCSVSGDFTCDYMGTADKNRLITDIWTESRKNYDGKELPKGEKRDKTKRLIVEDEDSGSRIPGEDGACCPIGYCYNGSVCIQGADQINDYIYESNANYQLLQHTITGLADAPEEQYVCAYTSETNNYGITKDADWKKVYKKEKYDDSSDIGYCLKDTECWDGAGCVPDGYYTPGYEDDDHYCFDGAWTTRTKLMASVLLQIKDDNSISTFTLYCDEYGNVLANKPADDGSFRDTTTAKVCTLKDESSGKTFTALALYSGSDDSDTDTISRELAALDSSLGITSGYFINCLNAENSDDAGEYNPCPETANKAYFNSKTKIIAYSDVEVSGSEFDVDYTSQNTWLKTNIIDNIAEISSALDGYIEEGAGLFSHTNDFENIYYSNLGGVKTGVRERVDLYKISGDDNKKGEITIYSALYSDYDICEDCGTLCTTTHSLSGMKPFHCSGSKTYSTIYAEDDDKTRDHWNKFIKNERKFKMLAFEDRTLTCGPNNNLGDEDQSDLAGASDLGFCSNYLYPGPVSIGGRVTKTGVPWYCSYNEEWDLALPATTSSDHGADYTANDRSFIEKSTDHIGYQSSQSNSDVNYSKTTPPDRASMPANYFCCPQIMCWNGTKCVHSSKGIADIHYNGFDNLAVYSYDWEHYPASSSGFDQYACENINDNGTWVGVYQKFTWDNSSYGFCKQDTQCWTGYFCLNSTQYIDDNGDWSEIGTGDHYCQDGKWTSRTKLVTLSILGMAESQRGTDYELLCSPISDFDEPGISSTDNNICLYRSDVAVSDKNENTPIEESDPTYQTTDDTIIVGASLDEDEVENFFIDNIEISDKDINITLSTSGTDLFQKAALESNTLIKSVAWNKDKRLLLFSNKDIGYSSITSFDQDIHSSFPNLPVYRSNPATKAKVTQMDRTFTKDYSRIFINTFTQAVRENPYNSQNDYVSIYYNLADYSEMTDSPSDFRSENSGNNYYILSSNPSHQDKSVSNLWQDLTRKFSRSLRCSYDNNYHTSISHPWVYSDHKSGEYKVIENPISESCCQLDKCWDGTGCISAIPQPFKGTINSNYNHYSNQFGNNNEDGYDMYVCFMDTQAYYENKDELDNKASWIGAYYKEKWDNTSHGYCLNEHDCWNGQECIPAGWYTQADSGMSLPSRYDPSEVSQVNIGQGDHFCEDGNWATRTKLLADKLLDFVDIESPDEYTIYCDTPTNTLINKEGFATLPGERTNNFCVLNYRQKYPLSGTETTKTLFATSINSLGDLDAFLEKVPVTDCNDAITNADHSKIYGKFRECSKVEGQVKMLYNNKTKLIIYSDDVIYRTGKLVGDSFIDTFFKNPFRTILSSVLDIFTTQTTKYRPITYTKDYDKFYISTTEEGSKTRITYGIMEEPLKNQNILTIKYEGFDQDFCEAAIYSYSASVSCDSTATDTTIVVGGTESELDPFWKDLTAETRIR